MKSLLATLLALLFTFCFAAALEPTQADFAALRSEAEAHYARGSFTLARRVYAKAAKSELSEAEAQWLEFRLADTRWRSAASAKNPDRSEFDAARDELAEFLEGWERAEERTETWALAQGSMGDLQWSRRYARNWSAAWPHYHAAFDYWAASTDLEPARALYLAQLEVILDESESSDWQRRNALSQLQESVLAGASRLARTPDEVCRTNYWLATNLQGKQRTARNHQRTREAFEAAIGAGRRADGYEAALYDFGVWQEEHGAAQSSAERGFWTEPDYVSALETFRKLVREFERGEARYWRNAQDRIKSILGDEVALSVGRFFLPGSELEVHLRWRNVDDVRLGLYELDLTRDVVLEHEDHRSNHWLDTLDSGGLTLTKRWKYTTEDDGLHAWGKAQLEMNFDLAPGAYLLEAVGGKARSRELVLVSSAGLIVKTAGDDVLAWFSDVETGEPIAGADVQLYHRSRNDSPWRAARGVSDEDGVVRFQIPGGKDARHSYYIAARSASRQAFSITSAPYRGGRPGRWKLHAFTDRAAYRPGQEVSWKLTARRNENSRYVTPVDKELEWQLVAQTGAVQATGKFTLNDFGSAWGKFEPQESWPLGLYSLRIHEPGEKPGRPGALLGAESIFRLEEYKLPEFIVSVDVARRDDGSPERFHPGDQLRATIAADYYFGGGVSEATVSVEVQRKAFWHSWSPSREFPWLYQDAQRGYGGWGWPGNRVHQETLKTGADGRVEFSFETGADDGQDYEYTITARVTDSSRREVSGSGTLRVTRQGWFAYLDAGHTLYKPGEAAEVELRTLDANQNPVSVSGELALLRRVWREVWISPQGQVIEGQELRHKRALIPSFPPPAERGKLAWKLEKRGYEDELVTSLEIETDAQGLATWNVALSREGFYIVRFAGEDERGLPVLTETSVYAATPSSMDLGYEAGRYSLLLDKDTFREGERGAIMIAAPASGRSVLFTVETEELVEYRVIHMDGTVKLISVDVNERWIPNVFVTAAGFYAGEAQLDTQRVVVPPSEHFLDVELSVEPEVCLPGEQASVKVKLTDHEGQPVVGEVALSLVDESIASIQQDLAIDPRQYFFGRLRSHSVMTRSSTHQKPFARFVRGETGELIDARHAWLMDSSEPGGGGARGAPMKKAKEAGGASGPASPGAVLSGSDDFFLGSGVRDQSSAGRMSRGPADSLAPLGELVVSVRKDFRETALWVPNVITDDSGEASFEFTYPDSLTRWTATARAATRESSFGQGAGAGRTRMPLSVRLQAPRFFVVGDECTVSLNLDNRTDEALEVAPELDIQGLEVLGFLDGDALKESAPQRVTLPAQGGLRLDWRIKVSAPGTAHFVATVKSAEVGDAIERTLPIYPHGVPVLEAKSGRFDGDGVDLVLDLPAARGAGSTEVFVQVTPSLAVTMLDALPYLVDYPYGCTEQTLSRFVPAAVVRHTLEKLGMDPEVAMTRAFGGIEAEFADKTQRETKGSLAELDAVTRSSLERLYGMQHGDGSWSWWSHGEGDPFMTAYVVWSLSLARDAGVEVDLAKLDAGGRWLGLRLVEEQKRSELHAWMLHAHARWLPSSATSEQRGFSMSALGRAMKGRAHLNAYGRALVALAAVDLDEQGDARILAENLIDGVIRDDAPDASIIPVGQLAGGTQSPRAHWGEDGIGYRWSDGVVEATAFALMALVAIDPSHELIEPAADWLVSNRRGAQWSNTKTTAIVVIALERYLAGSGQLDREVGFSVSVNGTELASRTLSGDELLAAPARFAVPVALLHDGANRVEVRRTSGEGPLFFSAQARFFSQEEPVIPRGHELFVRRQYFRLVAKPTLLEGFVYERVQLEDGDSLVSGERVEVVLSFEAKNHLEYLLFEDLKPAGLEATQLKSGESVHARELRRDEVQYRFGDAQAARSGLGNRKSGGRPRSEPGYTGRSRRVHQELRDRKVALFLDKCPEGIWELRYDLRAEAPGRFHALPVLAEAMYVPEIRANGAELRLSVEDRDDL